MFYIILLAFPQNVYKAVTFGSVLQLALGKIEDIFGIKH